VPRVVFTPSGLDGEVAPGTTVLQAARELGVDLDSVCGGRGICGRCQVACSPGSFPKWAIENDEQSLSPWGETEEAYQQRRGMKPERRLGCCAVIQDDVVLDVPPESQVHRPVVRKSLDLSDVMLDPAVHLYYIELPPSVLGDAESMSDLVVAELQSAHRRTVTHLSLSALQQVHKAFAGQDRAATVAERLTVITPPKKP
jgi:uncharacterized 2Fe-2S/4Fe-4S cluster protein (DUF4445 family)